MLSPVGVPFKPEEVEPRPENRRGPPKIVRSLVESAWEKKWSVFGMMRKSGSFIGRKLINSYLKRRMAGTFTEEEH